MTGGVLDILNDSDLALAQAVQSALMEGTIPQAHCGKMLLKNRMSGRVGGDFYHFRELGEDQVAFTIGDVMGHGTAAALLMALIMGHIQADRQNGRRPQNMVSGINDILLGLGRQIGTPITCSIIYGVVDLPSGLLLYVNAGHPHPIICNRHTGRTQHLAPTTMLLGVQAEVRDESCHQFRQGDRLVLFTDGLSEAQNSRAEMFGEQRLREFVTSQAESTAEEVSEGIFEQVDRFTQGHPADDDRTLVVIDFDKVSAGG